jgi:hypothetical protein
MRTYDRFKSVLEMRTYDIMTKPLRRRFPAHRKTVLDVLAVARGVPAFPLIRSLQVGELDSFRKASSVRIGWTALFLKAYALVGREIPELRDRYVKYPFSYLYRHPHTVASISVHRQEEHGNERLIWSRIRSPESQSLVSIQQQLSDATTLPVEQVFAKGIRMERRPWLVRRVVWWLSTNWAARNHSNRVGTFSISSLANLNCLNAFHPLIVTTSLAFGPIHANGSMDVVLICDHRTIDGVLAARALQLLEETLQTTIVEELSCTSSTSQAA